MTVAVWLFLLQGALGAFDTIYYHEIRARLPGGVPGTGPELALHATRDFVYAILFGSLPFVRWEGAWSYVLGGLLLAEIIITLRDFVVEDTVRRPLGGVAPGERVTHAVMGIVYGAALGYLLPELVRAAGRDTAFVAWASPGVPRLALPVMATGVFLSGLRDLGALLGPPSLRYPWTAS